MSSSNVCTPSRSRLVREWTASFFVLGLALICVYMTDAYLREEATSSPLLALLVLVVLAPLCGGLVGAVFRASYSFADHVRLFLLLTLGAAGGRVGRALGGDFVHVVGVITGVVAGAGLWWLFWQPGGLPPEKSEPPRAA